jgi:predicted ATPase/DNA-binding SARP family transcriptional activator/DNA-binding CsgD family transcriptional regulator
MNAEATSDPSQRRRSSSDGPFPVRLRLLGGFSVWVGSRAVSEGAWQLKKAKSLLKLLALAPGHRLHREQMMDLLWQDSGREAAANNLRQALHVARRALETDPSAPRYLISHGDQLVLCPDGPIWVDVEAFEKAANTARRSKDPPAYQAAIDLYSGELLPEDRYEKWAEGRRQELRRTFLSLLIELAGLYEERGTEEDLALAIHVLQRVLAEESTNEEAHVGLMRLYGSSGRSGEALRQYIRLSETLSSELGAQPTASTRALREEIAAGRFPGDPIQAAGSPRRETVGGVGQHNLPAQRTAFVGRVREILELKRQLAMTRLLTLTGTGGSGKTRLALEVAKDLVGAYPEGVWLIELAPLSEGTLVPQGVARAVRVTEQPGRPLTEALVDDLREKKMLLVLDNCEHLIEDAAQLVDALLSSCPRLQVLATSREVLGVEGELVWRVDPLSVPDADPDRRTPAAAGELVRYEAVRLFVERARLRSPHFELTEENAGAVAKICRRLEGIPLAIVLASARVRALSLEQISERLEDSLKLLMSDNQTTAPRHRTLRATLDWSHDLLTAEEQMLFRRLSTFAGNCTLEAAEAVGESSGVQEEDVFDLINMLVEKSLVVAEVRAGHVGRYRLLEPVRQYARERLEASGEADAFRRRHAEFFLVLAEEAAPELSGAQQQEWANRLEADHDNMRATLSWSLDNEPEKALQLAGTLARFWEMRARFLEGSRWLEAALRQGGHADAATRAKALREAGTFAFHSADYDRAIELHGDALALYREVGDDSGVAFALLCLGTQHLEKGDNERAAPLYEAALALSRKIGDRLTIVYALGGLAELARRRDEYERAKTLGMETIALVREMEDKWHLARNTGWVAMLTFWNGDDYSEAEGFLEDGLALNREVENWEFVAYCLEGSAGLAGAREQGARAARLWGAAEVLRNTIGAPPTPETRQYYPQSMAAAHALLGEAAWEAAFAEGSAMSAEEAVEYALSEQIAPAPERQLADRRTDSLLTRREKEIAELVARDLTNRQIAKELVVSQRTVDKHVANILKKLGLHSREKVAASMTERQAQLS